MRTFLFLALMAVCESVHAQPACPGIALRTSSSSDLRPSSSSRIRLIRQSDGRYTGYEIADVAPHRILQTIADFQTRTTPCGPWAFSQDPFDLPPEASARLADGRYLFVTAPVRAGIHAALFDASMNLLAEADTPATGDTVALSLTDLDGDGKLDVVASTALGRVSGVAVYRGLGGVSFQSPAV